jgi:hypothetical protein
MCSIGLVGLVGSKGSMSSKGSISLVGLVGSVGLKRQTPNAKQQTTNTRSGQTPNMPSGNPKQI